MKNPMDNQLKKAVDFLNLWVSLSLERNILTYCYEKIFITMLEPIRSFQSKIL
jgi:hypothetical protein